MWIPESEVHVWITAVSECASELSSYEALLSDTESERAESFTGEPGRLRFVVGRGVLRTLIGRYAEIDPSDVEIVETELGKPMLAPGHDSEFYFNVAHSEDLLAIALSCTWDIGIDVEYIRRVEIERLAPLCFAASERAELRKLRKSEARKRFFDLWTRKEAVLKAVGVGLRTPLASVVFELSDHDHEVPRLRSAEGLIDSPQEWSVLPLDVSTDYAAALAVPSRNPAVSLFDFE